MTPETEAGCAARGGIAPGGPRDGAPAEATTCRRSTRLRAALARLRPRAGSPASFLFAAACVALAILLRLALGPLVGDRVPFATLYPAVIVACLVGGPGAGLFSVFFGGAMSWLLVVSSEFPPPLPSSAEMTSLLFYGISAVLILIVASQRRSTEHWLREERDRARLYFETAGAFLIVLGTDGKVRLINRAGAEVLGAPAGRIVGRDWISTFIPERFHRRARKAFAACLEGRLDLAEFSEGSVLRADGSERLVAWHSRLLRDGAGRITGVLSSGEDVTDRRRAERELRESEMRFRALTESMPQLVWSTLPDGHCDFLGRQWQEYTGVPEEDHFGDGWLTAVHPDDRAQVDAAWTAATRLAGRYDVTYRLRGRDGGYRWFAARGVPVTDECGQVSRWFGTSTDITEIVEARQALEERVAARKRELEESNRLLLAEAAERRKAEEALARAQRLEAIGQLTGGVAHDFNNLLTVVVGNLDLIVRSAGDPDRVRRYATAALAAADRGESVTRQLLAFSRQQTLKPEVVDVNRLLGDFATLARRAAGEAIEVRMETEPGRLHCRLDPTQFEVAMLNLLVNARDATQAGGRIVVSTRVHRADCERGLAPGDLPPDVASALPAGGWVEISVVDDGTGIPAELLSRVFEPFFTTKDVGKGSGLGLSQVYGFVRQSGGHVRLESEPGRGTKVRILLPRLDEPTSLSGESRPSRTAPPAEAKGETILLVEDDKDVREIALGMLRGLGYAVLLARDGQEAIEVLESRHHIDLLFTDVVMPRGMSGVELARRAGRLRPGLPVLLSSGYAAGALTAEHGVADEMPLLRKPYRIGELARAVRTAMTSAPPASEASPAPRVLVVEDDVLVRLSTVAMLDEVGFTVVADTGSAESALARLAELGEGVDMLFTDVGLPGMDGRALAREATRRRPDLRVVFATGYATEIADGDAGELVVGKPFHRDDLARLREQLG